MSTQEEKRFKQWAAALAVYDSVHVVDNKSYWSMRNEAEPWRNVLRAEDKLVGQAVMEKPDYDKAMIAAQSVVEQYFIRIGVY